MAIQVGVDSDDNVCAETITMPVNKILLKRQSENVILRREPKNLEGVSIKVYKILRFAQNDN